MPEVDEQIRRYARDVMSQVERVAGEQVRGWEHPAGWKRQRRWQLVAAALIVMVVAAAAVGWLVGERDRERVDVAALPADMGDWGEARQVVGGEGAVWVAFGAPGEGDRPSEGSGGVVRLDTTGDGVEVVAEVADLVAVGLGDHPEGPALWAARRPGELLRFEAETGELQARIDLPPAPGFEDVDGEFLPNGVVGSDQAIWVTTARGFAAIVDPAQNQVREVVELVPDYPSGGAARGPVAWISQGHQGIARVDALASEPLQTLQPTVDSEPDVIITALTYHDGRLWVGGQHTPRDADTGAVWAVDPDRGTVLGTARTPGPVHQLAGAGETIWATGQHQDHAAAWQVPADLEGHGNADDAPAFPTADRIADLLVTDDDLWALAQPDQVLLRLDPDRGELRDSIHLADDDRPVEDDDVVHVPDVIQLPVDEAVRTLERLNFDVTTVTVDDNTADPGIVIEQDPPPGIEAVPESKVTIHITELAD